MSKSFAEKMNYWDTVVHPARSQAEILELLEDFGVSNCQVSQGQTASRFAWLIRFEWQGRTYHFVFTPLECQSPQAEHSFGGKRRTHREQAKYQMGRIAVYFVKAILTAAETIPMPCSASWNCRARLPIRAEYLLRQPIWILAA